MMDSLSVETPKEPVTVSAPDLRPRKKLVRKPVFLPQEVWDQLQECADFHGEVFREMGDDEKVSRNDIIQSFLKWAIDAYWKDKGGKPTNEKDRAAKVKRHAERLLKSTDLES